jgi:DNA end-binding protein Ku
VPRPIWKGHISFGLVTIPVVLQSAERETELHFNLLDRRDGGRVRYERVNEATGAKVPWQDVVKGYEYADGRFVLLGDQDFRRAAVEATRAVDIQEFVEETAVDPRYFARPYYLIPDARGTKGYVLLRETLQRSGRIGIAKVVIHTRQYLAAVLPRGKALVLNLLRFAGELRDTKDVQLPAESPQSLKISPKELDMAKTLIERMAGTWKPEKYRDDYRLALTKWIKAKVRRGDLAPAPQERESGKRREQTIVNMMDLLRKSVEQKARARRTAARTRKAGTATRKRA